MSSPVVADPVVAQFIERVAAGTNAAADSVAGLVLRLVGRVGALEKTVEAQAAELKRVDKLARAKPKLPRTPPPVRLETGVDVYGDPVRIEHKIRRPRGRPKGSRDRYERQTRAGIVPPAPSSYLLDGGWDDL